MNKDEMIIELKEHFFNLSNVAKQMIKENDHAEIFKIVDTMIRIFNTVNKEMND